MVLLFHRITFIVSSLASAACVWQVAGFHAGLAVFFGLSAVLAALRSIEAE